MLSMASMPYLGPQESSDSMPTFCKVAGALQGWQGGVAYAMETPGIW